MKFNLLQLPDNDYIKACVDTFINRGLTHDQDRLYYIEHLLYGMIDHYSQWPDDPYANHVSLSLTELLAILQEFHSKD